MHKNSLDTAIQCRVSPKAQELFRCMAFFVKLKESYCQAQQTMLKAVVETKSADITCQASTATDNCRLLVILSSA